MSVIILVVLVMLQCIWRRSPWDDGDDTHFLSEGDSNFHPPSFKILSIHQRMIILGQQTFSLESDILECIPNWP